MRNAPASPRSSTRLGVATRCVCGGLSWARKGQREGWGCTRVHACACVHVRVCVRRCVHMARRASTHTRGRASVPMHVRAPCAHACTDRAHVPSRVPTRVPVGPGSPPSPVGAPRPSLPARAAVPVGRGWERGACVIMPVTMETICSPGAGAAWARGRGGGGGSGAAAGCKGLGKGTAPWGRHGSVGLGMAPWGWSWLCGDITALWGWSQLPGDNHGSLGTATAPWGHHGSAWMAVAPWGWPQVPGDSHGSVGWSRLQRDSHRSVGTLRAPWGQRQLCRDVTAPWHRPWELLRSPCPSRGLGAAGTFGGRQGGRAGWAHTGAGTLGAGPHPLGPPRAPLGLQRPRQSLGVHRYFGGGETPPGTVTPKLRAPTPRPPPAFTVALQRLSLGTENLCLPIPWSPVPHLCPLLLSPPASADGALCPPSHHGAGGALWGARVLLQPGCPSGRSQGCSCSPRRSLAPRRVWVAPAAAGPRAQTWHPAAVQLPGLGAP